MSALARSNATRPSSSNAIVVNGFGGKCAKSSRASATSVKTASIIRSCRSGKSAARSSTESGAPSAVAMAYTTPRSMRETAERPQFRAMSVAFDDHGDSVPGRGTTRSDVVASMAASDASGP